MRTQLRPSVRTRALLPAFAIFNVLAFASGPTDAARITRRDVPGTIEAEFEFKAQ